MFRIKPDAAKVALIRAARSTADVMLLFLHGGILLFIPSLVSLAAATLLWLALKKVSTINENRIVYGIVAVVALFFTVAGALLFVLSADEVWYFMKYSFTGHV